MLLPFMVIGTYKLLENDTHCFFNSSKLKANKIESRVVMLQYAANNPIEDRYKVSQLTALEGYAMSVFDGHGGWQVAELAMRKLHDEFNRSLLANVNRYDSQDDWVQISLAEAH
jgi:serine/threonine protein phosphatase PrpC